MRELPLVETQQQEDVMQQIVSTVCYSQVWPGAGAAGGAEGGWIGTL